MYRLNTILAATDLTRRSAAVAARAVQLSREHGARLVIVHAIEPHKPSVKRFRFGKPSDSVAQATAQLEKLRAAHPDLDITCDVFVEKPAIMVPRVADEIGADLIVLGLHVARRVLETLRLTNLERITQAARCPVLIAHNQSSQPYRKVLGAITFAPASANALQVAARIAHGAEFHAIHALQLPFSSKLPSADIMTSSEMTEAELLRRAFMNLDGLPETLTEPEIVPGGVHEVLQFRIRELQPDLVVIGSHSGRDPESLGNYTRDLMRAPPTDMLIAKPE